ncbi:hypothetical protein FOCC_FOCC016076 [Frankliniella occidentalis]|nr:hypothetical protein FOCC_FOCC016076 [Frankliniella occidentalis]
MLFEKETDELVQQVDNEIKAMINSLIPLQYMLRDGKSVHVPYDLHFTMADGKICNILTNTTSNQCFVCREQNGNMNDLSTQRTTDPSTLDFRISPLHARLRCFELLLKVGQKIDVSMWKVPTKEVDLKIIVEAKKKVIQERFKKEMALIVDVPKPGGGTSNDGNTARRSFKAHKQSADILDIDPRIVRRFAVITAVLAYNEEVDVEAYAQYAKETAELYVQLYDWYPMSPTVHKMLIHGKEFLERNSFLPIGALSGEAQETLNKYIRHYRNRFSRKDERRHTNEDLPEGKEESTDAGRRAR